MRTAPLEDEDLDLPGALATGRVLLVLGVAISLWGLLLPTVSYRDSWGHLVADHLGSMPPVLALVVSAGVGSCLVAFRGRRGTPMPAVLAGLAIPLAALANAPYVITDHTSGGGVGAVSVGLLIGIVGFALVPRAAASEASAGSGS